MWRWLPHSSSLLADRVESWALICAIFFHRVPPTPKRVCLCRRVLAKENWSPRTFRSSRCFCCYSIRYPSLSPLKDDEDFHFAHCVVKLAEEEKKRQSKQWRAEMWVSRRESRVELRHRARERGGKEIRSIDKHYKENK